MLSGPRALRRASARLPKAVVGSNRAAAVSTAPTPRRIHVGSTTDKTPEPIERSESQAIPLGAYYEYILQEPQPIPKEKPEGPPSTAAKSAKSAAAESPNKSS